MFGKPSAHGHASVVVVVFFACTNRSSVKNRSQNRQSQPEHTYTHSTRQSNAALLEFAGEHAGQLVHCRIGDRLADGLIDLLAHLRRQLLVAVLQLLGADAARAAAHHGAGHGAAGPSAADACVEFCGGCGCCLEVGADFWSGWIWIDKKQKPKHTHTQQGVRLGFF